jgi:hypothetical protein
MTSLPDDAPAEVENQYHDYVSNDIPWYVRLLWLGFWILAITIVIQHLFPALQVELFQPP